MNKMHVVDPGAETFNEALGISAERTEELCDNMKDAYDTMKKGHGNLGEFVNNATKNCQNDNETLFITFCCGAQLQGDMFDPIQQLLGHLDN